MPQVSRGADSNQCATTPDELYLRIEDFWHPLWDLAASRENSKCLYYYDEEANALTKPWHEISSLEEPAWCNHPYENCKIWVKYAHDQALLGAFVIMLQPLAIHRAYYRSYIKKGPCVVVPLNRAIKFGGYTVASPTPHALYFWHKNLPGGVIGEWDYEDSAEGVRTFAKIKELITRG